jgi:hypothetical protein
MGVVPHEESPDKKSEAKDAPPASGEKAGGAVKSERSAASAADAKGGGAAAKDAPPASGEKAGVASWIDRAAASAADAKGDGAAAKSAATADHPGTASGLGHDLVCTPESDSAPRDKAQREEAERQKIARESFDPKALQKETERLDQEGPRTPQTTMSSWDGQVNPWHPPDVKADLDAMEHAGFGGLVGMAARYAGGSRDEGLADGARSGAPVDGMTGVVGGVVEGRSNKMQAEPQKDEAAERPPR